jgi:hypothetical protein
MWQALVAALFVVSIAGSRPQAEQPTLSFAALKRQRSSFAWYLGLSSVLHLLLIVGLAFSVELLRQSNRDLERSKQLYGVYTPLRTSLRTPVYYRARGAAGPGTANPGVSVRHPAPHDRVTAMLRQPAVQIAPVVADKMPAFLSWLPPVPPRPEDVPAAGPSRSAIPVPAAGENAGGSSGAPANVNPVAGTDASPVHTEPAVRIANTRAGRVEIRDFADGHEEIHYPPDGRFDAVVVQAGAGDLVPEAEDLLTGRPVQTVYLEVGTAREWVLQYCVPSDKAAAQSGMVVSLGGPTKMQAPWIRMVALPPRRARSPKATVFYGKLQPNGHFMDMRALARPQYQDRPELLPYLEQWEFRPAERDGVAAEIEVMLIIPPETAL